MDIIVLLELTRAVLRVYNPVFDTFLSKKSLPTPYFQGFASFLDLHRYVLFFVFCACELLCFFYDTSHSRFTYEFKICPEAKRGMQFIRQFRPLV